MSKKYYVKEVCEQINGKSFWSSKEFAFEEISIRGEGYSVFAYTYDEKISDYFMNPDSIFFAEYPEKTEYRTTWQSIKWTRTPVDIEETKILEIATPNYVSWRQSKLDKMDFVRDLANSAGGYYAYNTNNSDVDFYLISPQRNLIIIINHNQ